MKQILITWQMGPQNMFVKSISCKNSQTHLCTQHPSLYHNLRNKRHLLAPTLYPTPIFVS